MEISRLEAVSPRNIDWRRLTAKEILKYDTEGIEVPDVYLQWAKDFIKEVSSNDKDMTTYETDTQGANKQSDSEPVSSAQNSGEDSVADETATVKSAKDKRKQMEDNGDSVLQIGVEFIKDSKEKSQDANSSQSQLTVSDTNSSNEISALETSMQEILSQAGDIKSQIQTAKTQKNGMSKIANLQAQLKTLGDDAQSQLAQSGSDINAYQIVIDTQNQISSTAIDFGSETVEIGKDMTPIAPPISNALGVIATANGKGAIKSGENLQNQINNSSQLNQLNGGKINTMQSEIQSKTGVGAEVTPDKNNNNAQNTENKNDPANEKNQTAAITETDKAASATLDQILQSKIRKGM